MPISFNCPSCNAGLSVKEEFAGKNANCPQCGNAFTVPTPSAAPQVGPGGAPGGVNINPGAGAPAPGPAPGGININTGGSPSGTGGGIPAVNTGARPKPGAIPQPGPAVAAPQAAAPLVGSQPQQPYASPGMDMRSDAGGSGDPPRRGYPALNLAMQMYTILSILVLVLGGLGVAAMTIMYLMLAVRIGGTAWVMPMVILSVGSLYVFFLWISLKAAAEFIKLALNIEHDQHRTANGIRNLNNK